MKLKSYFLFLTFLCFCLKGFTEEDYFEKIGMCGASNKYWADYYELLAEALRAPCVAAGIAPPPSRGYCGEHAGSTSSNDCFLYDGGDGKWDTGPLEKGSNDNLFSYYKNDGTGGAYWIDTARWQDVPGGRNGVYDEGHDIVLCPGNRGSSLKDGVVGIRDDGTFYFDLNKNGRYDSNEEIWINFAFDSTSKLRALRRTIFSLLKDYYVNIETSDFSGLSEIPSLLEYDASGNPTPESVRLFPEREGKAAYEFTLCPGKLPDGTVLGNGEILYTDKGYDTIAVPDLPIHFEEIRQVLNRNLFRKFKKSIYFTSKGEMNAKYLSVSGIANQTQLTVYSQAVAAFNSLAGNNSRVDAPRCKAECSYDSSLRKYSFTLSKTLYSYLTYKLQNVGELMHSSDFYTLGANYELTYFNTNGDNLVLNQYLKFESQTEETSERNIEAKFIANDTPPAFTHSTTQLSSEGYNSAGYGTIIINFDGPNGFPKIDIQKPPVKLKAIPDTNRDDFVDIGIDIDSIDKETGTIVHLPEYEDPQVIIPLHKLSIADNLNIWEYISSGNNFAMPCFISGAAGYGINDLILSPWLMNEDNSQMLSTNTSMYNDIYWFDPVNNIFIKRVAIVRPRGQIVLFDFPWDSGNRKFSDIGQPLGINSERTYRLVRKLKNQAAKHLEARRTPHEIPNQYSLIFESGITHTYYSASWMSSEDYDLKYYSDIKRPNVFWYYYLRSSLYSIEKTGLLLIPNGCESIRSYSHIQVPIYDLNNTQGPTFDISFERNSKGLPEKISYKTKDGAKTITVQPVYDDENRIVKLKKTVPETLALDGKTEYEISVEGGKIIYPDGTTTLREQSGPAGTERTVTITKQTPGSGDITQKYGYNSSDLLTKLETTCNNETKTFRHEYYTDETIYPNTSRKKHRLKSVTNPDGSWNYFEYNANGWLEKMYSPYGNTPVNPSVSSAVTEYSYTPNDPDETFEARLMNPAPSAKVSKILAEEVARTYSSYKMEIVDSWTLKQKYTVKGATKKGATWDSTENSICEKELITKYLLYSLLLDSSYTTDLIKTTSSNEISGIPIYPGLSENYYRTNIITTTQRNSADGAGMEKITSNRNPRNIVGSIETVDLASGKTISSVNSETDSFGRITKTTYLDGTKEEFNNYCLFGPQEYIDRNGSTFTYKYDSSGRLSVTTTPLSKISWTYDVLGNKTSETKIPNDGSETFKELWSYDALGRIKSHTDAIGTTNYAYDGPDTKVTYPDGTDKIIDRNLDGSTKSISGSATPPISYEYGVDPAKGRWSKEINGTTWSQTFYNMLGKAYRTEYSTGYWQESSFDAKGRSNGTTDSEGRSSSITYNSRNEVESETSNGIKTDYAQCVVEKEGKTAFKTETTLNSSLGTIKQISENSVDGFDSWSSFNGRNSESHSTLLGEGRQQTVSKDFIGRTETVTSAPDIITSDFNSMASQTSFMDSHGRTTKSLDSLGNGIVSAKYRPGTGQMKDRLETGDAGPLAVSYAEKSYNPETQKLPDNSQIGFTFNEKGSLEEITGKAPSVFSAKKSFDELNRLDNLATTGERGKASTRWTYNQLSGLPESKLINGRKVAGFSYHPDGRLASFTRTIGEGTEVTQGISYTPPPQLLPAGYSWSDGTSSVTLSGHNSFGQPATISTGNGDVCKYDYEYNKDSQIQSSSLTSPITEDRSCSYEYNDKMLRSKMTSGKDVVDYQSDEPGRLVKIISGNISAEYEYVVGSFNMLGKITVKKDDKAVLVRDFSYETGSTRIKSVTNSSGDGSVFSSFEYEYNPSAKIAKVNTGNNTEWRYTYDDRGQISSATRLIGAFKTADFAYKSDSISNLLEGGRKSLDKSPEFRTVPALLNSIETKINQDKVEVSGSVVGDASITVNNMKPVRNGMSFFTSLDAGNKDSASQVDINVVAARFEKDETPEVGGDKPGNVKGSDIVNTVNASVFMPKKEDDFTYDQGGRLLENSQWKYSWNSDDRLTSIESSIGVPPVIASPRSSIGVPPVIASPRSSIGVPPVIASPRSSISVPPVKIINAYDHAGRRIKKSVFKKSSDSSPPWRLCSEFFFYYDTTLLNGDSSDFGLLTGEKVVNHETNETHEYQYLWGLDLDGSYQGLGGVGGLIAVIDKTNNRTYIPCSDAKGTIHSYIDSESCAVVAAFAYDPYGKLLSSTVAPSPYPLPLALLFQGKYYDSETALYYFGFRYYDPATGRWLNRDPLGEDGGYNLYAFCNNDPVNGIDPLGLAGYFFDGTRNHPYSMNLDGTPNFKTNIRILFESYKGEASYAFGIGSGYHADGTRYRQAERGKGDAFVIQEGITGTTMEARVDFMMEELKKNLQNKDKVVDLFGFSRGAASATLFLNRIQEKIDSGDPLYQGINVRFVSLIDQVPTKRNIAGQTVGRSFDTLGYACSLTFWSPDTFARNANNEGFSLPKGMAFQFRPLHLVSIDEMRKEFACSDIEGALQIGFRGVHSNLGAGYGGSLFEFITREFIIEKSQADGLDLFEAKKYTQYDGPYRPIYNNYRNNFIKGHLTKIPLLPTDNSDVIFNDNEPRHLPKNLIIHPSAYWFIGSPYNSIN